MVTLREGTYTWDDMRRWSIVALGVDLTEQAVRAPGGKSG